MSTKTVLTLALRVGRHDRLSSSSARACKRCQQEGIREARTPTGTRCGSESPLVSSTAIATGLRRAYPKPVAAKLHVGLRGTTTLGEGRNNAASPADALAPPGGSRRPRRLPGASLRLVQGSSHAPTPPFPAGPQGGGLRDGGATRLSAGRLHREGGTAAAGDRTRRVDEAGRQAARQAAGSVGHPLDRESERGGDWEGVIGDRRENADQYGAHRATEWDVSGGTGAAGKAMAAELTKVTLADDQPVGLPGRGAREADQRTATPSGAGGTVRSAPGRVTTTDWGGTGAERLIPARKVS
jgi:hypothetical protein